MEEHEKKEIIAIANLVPYWVQDKKNALEYARHLSTRLMEKQEILAQFCEFLKEINPKLHDEIWERTEFYNIYEDYKEIFERLDEK